MNILPLIVPATAAATGVAAWGALVPSAQLYGPTLRHTSNEQSLALTFDDGPNPRITPRLLDLFDRYSVKATFFVIGRFVRACPDIVRDIAGRGHLLGNHTDTHLFATFESSVRIREELLRCQDAIATAVTGDPPRWMRPPGGKRSPMLYFALRGTGLQGVAMWSVSSRDWKAQPTAELVKRLALVGREHHSLGDIVLFHDGTARALGGDCQNTLTALEYWLPRWRDAGLRFVTIESTTSVV